MLLLIFAVGISFTYAGDVTKAMQDTFLASFKAAVEKQSVQEYYFIWSVHQLDDERVKFMNSVRKGILEAVKNEFGESPLYEFKRLDEPPYNRRNINERLVIDKRYFRDIPTREVAVVLQITENSHKNRFPRILSVPLVIEDGRLKHIAWRREEKQ